MKRSRLLRWILTAAALLGAVPLMAQAPPAAPTGVGFPFGRYALVAVDPVHGPPPGIEVEFTPSVLKVFQGPQEVESHTILFANGNIQFFELGGECGEIGEYSWKAAGEWLELTQVNDPCQQRAQSIMAVHFKKL